MMAYSISQLRRLSDEALAEGVVSALAVINTIAPTFASYNGTRRGIVVAHENLEHAMVALLDYCKEQARRNTKLVEL